MPNPTTVSHRRACRPASARAHAGVSLVESLVVLAVMAVLVGTTLPGWGGLVQRRHLEGVAAQLETDLQLARAEAVARNQGVRVGFTVDADGGACYVLHTGSAGDCQCNGRGVTTCLPGAEALRRVPLPADQPVRLASNSRSILFDPVAGTVTPTATVRLTAPIGQVRQIVNVMGRVRSCTPDGALPGVRPC